MEVVLGIDIGTSHIKSMALDATGCVQGVERARTPVAADGHGPVHVPRDVVEAVTGCVRRLLRHGPWEVVAVAVTSVGEEGVPLAGNLEPLYPAIAWYDGRTRELTRKWGAEEENIRMLTGLAPGWEYTLWKLLWLREQGIRPAWWLPLSDYVAWYMSGEMALSVSQACRTMLFNLASRRLDEGLLDRFALPAAIFPPVKNGGEVLGAMRPAVARAWGLERAPTVAVGGHDHVVGARAMGLATLGPDELLDSKGTAEALMCPREEFIPGRMRRFPDLVCGLQAEGDRYYVMGSLWSGAGLAGAARLVGAADIAALGEAAGTGVPGSHGLRYRPPDRIACGRLEGLGEGQERGDLARSFFEGWSFAVRFMTERLEAFCGRSFARVVVCGGGSRVPLALDVQAAVLNRPLRLGGVTEAAALGACLLAGRSLGMAVRPRDGGTLVRPRPGWVETYDGIYRREYLPLFGDKGGG